MNIKNTLETAKLKFEQKVKVHDSANYPKSLKIYSDLSKTFLKFKEWEFYLKTLDSIGDCHLKIGNFEKAISTFNDSLEKSLKFFGEEHSITKTAYHNIGRYYLEVCDYDNAIVFFEKVKILNKKDTSISNLILAKPYIGIGNCYYKKKEFNKASKKFQFALSILQEGVKEEGILVAFIKNSLGLTYFELSKYNEAIGILKESLALKERWLGTSHISVAHSYINIGIGYWKQAEYDKAVKLYHIALKKLLSQVGEKNPNIATLYNNLGVYHINYGDPEQAYIYYQKALEISINYFGADSIAVVSGYLNIGRYYEYIGDYELALVWYNKTLSVVNNKEGFDKKTKVNAYVNMGVCLFHKGDLEASEQYFQEAQELAINCFGKEHIRVGDTFENLAGISLTRGEVSKAIEQYQKSLQISAKCFGGVHPTVAESYDNIGVCYRKSKKLDLAFASHDKALEIKLQFFDEFHSELAPSYFNIANCYFDQKQVKKGLSYLQSTLQCLIKDFSPDNSYVNPKIDKYWNIQLILDTLIKKAEVLYSEYVESKQQDKLKLCYETCILSISFIDKILKTYSLEASKLLLHQKAKTILSIGINALWLQKDKVNPFDEILFFMEKGKTISLYRSILDIDAKISTNISTELIKKEHNLRIKLSKFNKRINEEHNKQLEERNNELLSRLQSEYYQDWKEFDKLIYELERNHPDYYQLKYNTQLIRIEQIQQSLNKQTILIEYFITPNSIFVFIITNQNYHIEQIEKQPSLVESLQSFIIDLHTAKENPDDYWRIAYELYNQLWQPIEKYIPSHIQHLLIIPDEDLSLLPFEALITNPLPKATKIQSLQNAYYLIQDYEISYHYSANLWHYIQQKRVAKECTTDNFIGFAPIYKNKNSQDSENELNWKDENNSKDIVVEGRRYSELRYSETEVEQVKDAFETKGLDAKTLLHQESTKNRFIQETKAYKHILVSAHHSEELGIAFSPEFTPTKEEFEDELLTLAEAYNLDLMNTDLLVLSCCSSGVGKQIKGEGIMSINRGFLYAGARNIICTLFKIYEKESAELVRLFYEQILEGKTYSQALRAAKLNMLQGDNSHPVDWAGFILIGIQ